MIYPRRDTQFLRRSLFQNKTFVLIISLVTLVAIGIAVFLLVKSRANNDDTDSSLGVDSGAQVTGSIADVENLWKSQDYQKIVDISGPLLENDPINFFLLLYRGYSEFYLGISQPAADDKAYSLDAAIRDLRKALAVEPYRQNNGDIFYVLGKAYYHKGYYFLDLALSYLLKAGQTGYRATDLNEYLGLANADLKKPNDAIDYFKRALDESKRPIVMLSLAREYVDLNQIDTAMDYVQKVITTSEDKDVVQQARFLRGDLLRRQNKFDESLEEYASILKENPNSADAHFYLGEAYFAKGDTIKARAEWRAAYAIDPKHSGAINRLNS